MSGTVCRSHDPHSGCVFMRQKNRYDLFETVWKITLRVEICNMICLLLSDTICLHRRATIDPEMS